LYTLFKCGCMTLAFSASVSANFPFGSFNAMTIFSMWWAESHPFRILILSQAACGLKAMACILSA
jgi:hypothetical protein